MSDAIYWVGIIVVLLIWSIVIKAWALWVAGRRNEKWWFICFSIVHTLGILEVAYILTRPKTKKIAIRVE